MNSVIVLLAVGLTIIVLMKWTSAKVESMRYRNNLKMDKLARRAKLARKAENERIAQIERTLLINNNLSNAFKSSELLTLGYSKVNDENYLSPIVEVLEIGSGDTIYIKRYMVSVVLQDGKVKSCTKVYVK